MPAEQPQTVVAGKSHLAREVCAELMRRGITHEHIADPADDCGRERLRGAVGEVRALFAISDDDRLNIDLALAAVRWNESLRVVISMFGLGMGERFERRFPNCRVLSAMSLAAPLFADAVRAPLEHPHQADGLPKAARKPVSRLQLDPVLVLCLVALLPLMAFGVTYFHYRETMSWIDAMYFVAQAVSGVDFGNIGPRDPNELSKALAMGLLFLGGLGSAILFALVTDLVLRKRIELALGRRKYSGSGHTIVCGLGACGYRIVEELLARGERVIGIEKSDGGRFVDLTRKRGVPVMIGDAALDEVLIEAGVLRAHAVIGATNNDLANLEIGLSANALNAAVRVILRIFDHELASNTAARLGIDYAASTSHLAAPHFLRAAGFPIEDGGLPIAD